MEVHSSREGSRPAAKRNVSISARTWATAVVVSESRTVRIFRRGKLVSEVTPGPALAGSSAGPSSHQEEQSL
jgi:hypothetical protein